MAAAVTAHQIHGRQIYFYIKKLLHDLNLPRRLNEINMDRSKFNNVADIALTYSGMDKLPKVMTHDAITTILDQAY